MPENEFEKQVQKRMDGFKLQPGDAIWKTVSAKIGLQKTRRLQLVLSIAFIGCFLIATLVLSDMNVKYYSKKENAVNAILSTKTNIDSLGTNDIEIVKKYNQPNSNKIVTSNVYAKPVKEHLIKEAEPLQQTNLERNQLFVGNKKIQDASGKKIIHTSGSTAEDLTNDSLIAAEKIKPLPYQQNKTEQLSPSPVENIVVETSKSIAKKMTDSVVNNPDTTTTVKKETEKKKKTKWDIGIVFTVGQSSTAGAYLGSIANSSYYDQAALSNSNNGNSSQGNYEPSEIKPGIAFNTGITTSKKLSAKTNFTIGINYKLFTTSIVTGNYTSLNGVISYGQGNTNRYNNYYHFIEIPLAIQLQVANIKKHPMYFEGGIILSQLVSTNALQYNAGQNKYYIDNSLFNKTIIGLSAGLFINLVSNNKAPLLLGPQFYYSASSIAGSGLYANTHYSLVGISVRKMLKKK